MYGIYNAGKSTLVNVLCGKEVAEVGDRPTTAKTQPYDAGKYILMDTPGIDAPIKHEMEADENMNNCHVILFVVSSKGGFESRKNYERMVEMIQRGLPWYVILNDRGSATTDEQEHQRELESIQQKIITNLIQVSGDDHIDEKYEVITLNTKRAWTGIQRKTDPRGKKRNTGSSASSGELAPGKRRSPVALYSALHLERASGEGNG